MRKFLIYLSNGHEKILKAFLILITLWVIGSLLPHKVRYKFDIKKGTIWNYDDLYSPFDFAVYKDPDSLKLERQKVASEVLPHFFVDTTVEASSVNEFERKLQGDTLPASVRLEMIATGDAILREIFDKGIIRISDSESPGPGNRFMLVRGKTASATFVSDCLNLSQVRKYVEERLRNEPIPNKERLITRIAAEVSPNVFYDGALTEKIREQQQALVSATRGMIRKGELIISRGEQINHEHFLILESLRRVTESSEPDKRMKREIYWSQLFIIAICLSMLLIFLGLLRKDIFDDNRKVTLIFTLIIMIVAIYTGIMKMATLSVYVVPLCILPVVIRVFFDTRLALFAHVITVLILGTVAPNGYEFVFMQVIAGMVTIFSVTNLRKRAQLFISAGMILIGYLASYFSLSVIQEGDFKNVELSNAYWLVGNVLLTLFAYPLIYIFEKIFGLTSDISLIELSDTNSPLLRELSIKAPGTFQHSMQVANLAEAAAFRIGGNTLLVRVGALYHDIGKMDMPLYFIENQTTGVNPHDELSFDESASIIISHVIRGIEKARKHKLPDLIIDFIRTHHGTSMVQYFYQSYLKNFPEKIVDEDDFRYPGPLPFSKETAVLMMADSVEAASRSLKNVSHDSINKLVDYIIDSQIENQQFVNCDITFRDISSIKKIFKKMLMSIYHVRVEYPSA